METSARNLVITLALPHLSCEEDRVDFLAEQAILGALCLHGPVVARRAIRRTAKMLLGVASPSRRFGRSAAPGRG